MYVISLQTTQSISSLWPKSFVFNSDFSTTFFGFFSGEISVYGTRWTSHSPFDYFTESDNHWFRFNQLSPVHAEMESRHRSHARPVQGDWQRTLYDGECGLVWSVNVPSVCFQSVQCNIPTFCMWLQMTATSETVMAERKNSILKYPNSCGSND